MGGDRIEPGGLTGKCRQQRGIGAVETVEKAEGRGLRDQKVVIAGKFPGAMG